MARPAARIVLSEEERKQLEAMRKRPRAENRYAERARIILSAAQGWSNKEIARALNTREARVSKWRVRFEREGLSGLHDDFRAGRPCKGLRTFVSFCWHAWMRIRRRGLPAGTADCWPRAWGRARIGYGGNCGFWASVCNVGAVGAYQPIRSFRKRRPM